MCWSKLEWEQWQAQRDKEREAREEPVRLEDEPREREPEPVVERDRELVEV